MNDVLDKIAPVVFLIVILLDARQGHGQQRGEFGRLLVSSLHKKNMLAARPGAKRLIGIAVPHKALRSWKRIQHVTDSLTSPILPRSLQAMIGHRFIDHTDGAVDGLPHLMDDALEKPVRHTVTSPLSNYFPESFP